MSDSEEIKKLRSRLNIVGFAALGAVALIFVSVFSAGDRSPAVAFALVMMLALVFLLVRYCQLKLRLRKASCSNQNREGNGSSPSSDSHVAESPGGRPAEKDLFPAILFPIVSEIKKLPKFWAVLILVVLYLAVGIIQIAMVLLALWLLMKLFGVAPGLV